MAQDNGNDSLIPLERRANLISETYHRFVVVDGEIREGQKGKYINFVCEVAEGGPEDGMRVYHMVSMTPASRFRMDEWLNALRFPENGNARLQDFFGRTFIGLVYTDTYEKKDDEGHITKRKSSKLEEIAPEVDPSGNPLPPFETGEIGEGREVPPPMPSAIPSDVAGGEKKGKKRTF